MLGGGGSNHFCVHLIYTFICTHIYRYIHRYTYTYTQMNLSPIMILYVCNVIYIHMYKYVHIYTYTYTHIHIYTYTHIYTYIYTYIVVSCLSLIADSQNLVLLSYYLPIIVFHFGTFPSEPLNFIRC